MYILIKIFILSLFLGIASRCKSQLDSMALFGAFEKSVMRHIDFYSAKYDTTAYKFVYDSCTVRTMLLKIEIDSNYTVSSVLFSDNADQAIKNELTEKISRLNLQSLNRFAKLNRLRNGCIIIPVIIKIMALQCNSFPLRRFENDYFHFKGHMMAHILFFSTPIEITTYPPVH